jgi:hypothetical protein
MRVGQTMKTARDGGYFTRVASDAVGWMIGVA